MAWYAARAAMKSAPRRATRVRSAGRSYVSYVLYEE